MVSPFVDKKWEYPVITSKITSSAEPKSKVELTQSQAKKTLSKYMIKYWKQDNITNVLQYRLLGKTQDQLENSNPY